MFFLSLFLFFAALGTIDCEIIGNVYIPNATLIKDIAEITKKIQSYSKTMSHLLQEIERLDASKNECKNFALELYGTFLKEQKDDIILLRDEFIAQYQPPLNEDEMIIDSSDYAKFTKILKSDEFSQLFDYEGLLFNIHFESLLMKFLCIDEYVNFMLNIKRPFLIINH
jgi:hypothetical protein